MLIVDDNRDAAELLADSLRALGHVVAVAFDGPSGLETASSFEPEIALLDLGLPMMDGFELARRLRANGRGRRCGWSPSPATGRRAIDRNRARPGSTLTSSSRWMCGSWISSFGLPSPRVGPAARPE